MRDMLFALVVLCGLVLLVGGLTRSCAFAPSGPTVDSGALPVVDAPALLRTQAGSVPFPVRAPEVPGDWRANAVDRDVVDGARIVRAGYLTPQGRYVRLSQSDAPEEVLVAREGRAVGAGVVDVGGRQWVAYTAGDETVWTSDVDGVRMLITGSGDEAEFRTLAAAAVAAVPLTP